MNKNLIFISLGRASQMILMFATYRVLSKLFSVEDMGGYYFLLSIAGAFGLIYANPLGMYANRKIHEWKNGNVLNLYLKKLTITYALGIVLIIPFIFLFKNKLASVNLPLFYVITILIFYVLSSTLHSTFVPTLNLLGESVHFVIWTFITSVLGLVFSLIFVKFFALDPMYWLLGQAFAFFIFGCIAYGVIYKKFPDKIKIDDSVEKIPFKLIIKFTTPIAFTNIFVWSMAQSFRFFLKDNVNPTALGEMAFGLGLASSLSVAVEYLFQQLFLPGFYQGLGQELDSKERAWNVLLNKVTPSYFAYCAYLFGLSPFLMRVLADIKFKNAGHFLAMGAFVEFFRMSSNIFTMATHAEMKTEKAFFPYLLGGGGTLISVLYISKHPELVTYTPLVLALGYLCSCILLAFNVSKFFRIKVKMDRLLLYVFLSILFLIPSFLLRKYSENLYSSIGICFIFGLILLSLFYQQYKYHENRNGKLV